jgi:hypothetical protein
MGLHGLLQGQLYLSFVLLLLLFVGGIEKALERIWNEAVFADRSFLEKFNIEENKGAAK